MYRCRSGVCPNARVVCHRRYDSEVVRQSQRAENCERQLAIALVAARDDIRVEAAAEGGQV